MRKVGKRGGRWIRTTMSGKASPSETTPEELLALDAAVERLHECQRQVIEPHCLPHVEDQAVH